MKKTTTAKLLGFSFAALAYIFPFQVFSQEAPHRFSIIKESDFRGFDLKSLKASSLDECKSGCGDDDSCKAFAYVPDKKLCFLKSDFQIATYASGLIAGKIDDASSAVPDAETPPHLDFIAESFWNDAREVKTNLDPADADELGFYGLTARARSEVAAAHNELIAQRVTEANAHYVSALQLYRAALALAPDDIELWKETARVAYSVKGDNEVAKSAILAAINAYQLTKTTQSRAEVLLILEKAFENASFYREALNSYKESLKLHDSPSVRAEYTDLNARQGFRIVSHTIDNDSVTPRACVEFSETLIKNTDYTPFVTLNGAAPAVAEAQGKQICVEGLVHGQRYKLAIRFGLLSSFKDPLEKGVELELYIKDRSSFVRFTGENFVLPSTARRGIPLVSVNLTKADLKLYRIGDRSIAPLLNNSQFLTQIGTYDEERIENESGELVWQGSIDIKPDLNKDVVTSFPVDEALPRREPGVYVLTASSPKSSNDEWTSNATQWFVVSDTGLTTYAGTDGLNVFARSLASAKPLPGVKLQLLAKNNEVLGTATTDTNGRATFTAGLVRGTAALTPAVITAQNGDSDYVFLDMTRAGFDLSDRGVTGRPAPGAIDSFVWTERGIYRAGETVHAAALVRDIKGAAIENLPLTFVFTRPDGVEDRRLVSQSGTLGGHTMDLPLQANAMLGTWTMRVYVDPKASAIGEKDFLVDDFVPDRTALELKTEAKEIGPDTPATINIEGKYLYGAPAAGLTLEGDIVFKAVREREGFENYVFGLADEEPMEDARFSIDGLPATDEKGEAVTDLTAAYVPSTTQLVDSTVYIRMQESGGRAIERSLTIPVKNQGIKIGIRPEFRDALPENSIAKFHVIALGEDGQKQPLQDMQWKLVSLERDYQWYRDGSSWRYESITNTKKVASGTANVTKDGVEISVPVSFGRYRLELETSDINGPAASYDFDAGWFVEASSTETPDALEIALDKQNYKVGETAKLKISSRYAGEAMIAVGTESLVATHYAHIDASGSEIDIPVTSEWGTGAYLTATLFRPGDAQENHMPMRSIGIKWLNVDPQQRKLQVSFDVPEKMQPRQPLKIGLQVTGEGVTEDAYVTIAAVDVGILNLTRYETPRPDQWYFGQRQLGLEIRDIYGRLIDGSLGATGKLRTGGDGGVVLNGAPPTQQLVSFFSGPVKLDAEGKASVSFDIPQFNGTVRVAAVAWSKSGMGSGDKDVIVRDPLVVTASLPRFLAPGDQAQLRLDVANTDAPSGDYSLQVESDDIVSLEAQDASQTLHLEAGSKTSLTLPLKGLKPGNSNISVVLADTAGLSLAQNLNVPVRPAVLPLTEQRIVTLEPEKDITIDRELFADSILADASLSINVTRSAAFDIPALVMLLDRYPYGCAEQITSRALPLLYLSEMTNQAGLEDDQEVHNRVQKAIYTVLSYQSSIGSFGLWGPDSGDLWLDAYVTDFLTRAREQKYDVPEEALVQALENLQNSLSYDANVKEKGNEIAYALYVLARNKKASINDLRYYADTMLDDFPTPLSKAHLAAAFALYGDAQRSKNLFVSAFQMSEQATLVKVSLSRSDYGSSLRDGAAVLALAAESRPVPPIVPELTKIVAKEWEQKKYTSTQEQAWMLLAARALRNGDSDIRLEVNGTSQTGGFMLKTSGDNIINKPIQITNHSVDPVVASITTVAAPVRPLEAGGNGFTIERTYYTLDGEEVDVSSVQQNQRYVVVLHVNKKNDLYSRLLITDLLPAGFAIDNPSLVNSAQLSNFSWLGDVQAAHTEFRSDRFVAAFNQASDEKDITVAYVVRAVTVGNYAHPAASVEDMYRPQFSARTATGHMEVTAAQ